MARWTLIAGHGIYEGLTLSDLESMARAGRIVPADLLSRGRDWVPVAQVPFLANRLGSATPTESDKVAAPPVAAPAANPGRDTPRATSPVAAPKPTETLAQLLAQRKAKDGKEVPPELVAALLTADLDRARERRHLKIAKAVTVAATLLFLVEALLLARAMLVGP